MKNNHILKALRISAEMEAILNQASEELGMRKTDLCRFLLNRSLRQLKSDSINAGGFDKLEFSIRR